LEAERKIEPKDKIRVKGGQKTEEKKKKKKEMFLKETQI
jgi:hypothetical protein